MDGDWNIYTFHAGNSAIYFKCSLCYDYAWNIQLIIEGKKMICENCLKKIEGEKYPIRDSCRKTTIFCSKSCAIEYYLRKDGKKNK